jgi:hypothetical protein
MNSRRFRRIPFEAIVTIRTDQGNISGELLDVALKGALIGTDAPVDLPLESECDLNISIPDSPIKLDFKARLIHQEGNHSGFLFTSEDLDTLTHLRKLIELNTGDVEATRSELMTWLSD